MSLLLVTPIVSFTLNESKAGKLLKLDDYRRARETMHYLWRLLVSHFSLQLGVCNKPFTQNGTEKHARF